ncbi:lysis system i-spanin subunit Rz [Arsenophonus endosymbiont of Aleurodicus floccissimus]|uniref:lysis system i-spanin subunit Rz n=1 Tax=Arsenophonus endosymbiont of Aleurodicus floccissimus TaxID=2152761 RepID=UPI0011C4080A|nr:lysis system i-spanin subunit Rz [Arsenophonus endosymbiont of Aleurodicus floccissimus]
MLWRPYIPILIIIVGLMIYLSNYQNLKTQYQTLKQQYREKIEVGKLYQQELEDLHQLDIQQTKELNNAKAEIARLYDAGVLATSGCASTPCVQHPKPLPLPEPT